MNAHSPLLVAFDETAPTTLRPYQAEALAMVRREVAAGRRRIVLQLPTAAGKTRIAADICNGALRKGRRAAFTVPMLSLVNQTVDRFRAEGIFDIGVMQAGHELTDRFAPMQVISLQTLARRKFDPPAVMIVDEVHVRNRALERLLDAPEWADVPVIGLSATPWSRGLGKRWECLLVPVTMADLILDKWLSGYRVFAPSTPDLSGVSVRAGDYAEEQLAEVMGEGKLVADIVETWKQLGEKRPTICFAVDRAHARKIEEEFIAAGIAAEYADAFTPPKERDAIGERLRSGATKIVCNVGIFCTGTDWPFVACLIMARPTKSPILFCQQIGRGLRTYPDKKNCLSRGTLVLTDQGEVPIEDITLAHRVWDGCAFVSHGGAIQNGVQSVIEYDGITATPDHRVMTHEGWQTLELAAYRQLRISRTGIGRQTLRFPDDLLSLDRGPQLRSAGRCAMRPLRQTTYVAVPQSAKEAEYCGLPVLQWAQACDGAKMAVSALSRAVRSLHQSKERCLRTLRWTWYRISIWQRKRSGTLDCRQSWPAGSEQTTGSHQQRWPLRAGQSSMGASGREFEQYEGVEWLAQGSVHRISTELPSDKIFRPDVEPINPVHVGRGNYRPLVSSFKKTEREVWDILNAGPLQRFTANGRLVHNCLVLDHAGNTLNLGFPADIHYDELDSGKGSPVSPRAVAKDRQPKECPNCKRLRPVGVFACPNCGAKPETASKIQVEEGELHELDKGRKRSSSHSEKQSFYSGLLRIAETKGYNPGWAAHKFKKKFKAFPRGLAAVSCAPSAEVIGFVRYLNIAAAKAKGRAA